MRKLWRLDVLGKLLPNPDLVALRACILLFLLEFVLHAGLVVRLLILVWVRALVKSAGTRSAEKLLRVRRQQSRIFGHAVDEFDGPDVVLLLLLLLHRRRDVDPFRSPLPDGKTCDNQLLSRDGLMRNIGKPSKSSCSA